MTDIIETFQEALERQQYLQTMVFNSEKAPAGVGPAELSTEDQIQFIKDMVLATEDELHEALGEVGWKPWASSRHINREAYIGELVDAFHFFMNLMLVVDCTVEELLMRYHLKTIKNIKRQEEGYDGIAGKCPGCHRALDDDAVTCHKSVTFSEKFWCSELGYIEVVEATS